MVAAKLNLGVGSFSLGFPVHSVESDTEGWLRHSSIVPAAVRGSIALANQLYQSNYRSAGQVNTFRFHQTFSSASLDSPQDAAMEVSRYLEDLG